MTVHSWPMEVRDLKEFFEKHRQLQVKLSIQKDNEDAVVRINQLPSILSECIEMFADWMADVDVPSYQRKGNTEMYIKNQVNNLKHLINALKSVGIDPDKLPISQFEEEHIAVVHDYLSQFANKTYNDKVATYRALFKFLISKEYEIKNLWLNVRPKATKAKTDIIALEDFRRLCMIVTPEGGVKLEKKGGSRIGIKNLYRDYLVDAWEYALYSGCRPEEIGNVKLEDVRDKHIVSKNLKASRATKREEIRFVPILAELHTLINRLVIDHNLQPNDYLIAPFEKNRTAMMRTVSNAFSHYWKQISDDSRIFYDLRNTYATAMLEIVGAEFKGRIGLHADLATTIKNYQNEQKSLENMFGKSLFG